MPTMRVRRYHDISCGHRVVGHEGKCAALHGHNYRIHFICEGPNLDTIGRVVDFSVIKSQLCMWVEDNWDHRFLIWAEDPLLEPLRRIGRTSPEIDSALAGLIEVPFNPTAENMGEYLIKVIAPGRLTATGVTLVSVVIEETRKCSAEISL